MGGRTNKDLTFQRILWENIVQVSFKNKKQILYKSGKIKINKYVLHLKFCVIVCQRLWKRYKEELDKLLSLES